MAIALDVDWLTDIVAVLEVNFVGGMGRERKE